MHLVTRPDPAQSRICNLTSRFPAALAPRASLLLRSRDQQVTQLSAQTPSALTALLIATSAWPVVETSLALSPRTRGLPSATASSWRRSMPHWLLTTPQALWLADQYL